MDYFLIKNSFNEAWSNNDIEKCTFLLEEFPHICYRKSKESDIIDDRGMNWSEYIETDWYNKPYELRWLYVRAQRSKKVPTLKSFL